MRGRLRINFEVIIKTRNTPAYVGKTCITTAGITGIWKHPRVCGEDLKAVNI